MGLLMQSVEIRQATPNHFDVEKSELKTITIEILVYLSFEFPGGHQRGQQWNARRTALFTSLSLLLSKKETRALGVVAPSLFFCP
jgi:hypothetical protein